MQTLKTPANVKHRNDRSWLNTIVTQAASMLKGNGPSHTLDNAVVFFSSTLLFVSQETTAARATERSTVSFKCITTEAGLYWKSNLGEFWHSRARSHRLCDAKSTEFFGVSRTLPVNHECGNFSVTWSITWSITWSSRGSRRGFGTWGIFGITWSITWTIFPSPHEVHHHIQCGSALKVRDCFFLPHLTAPSHNDSQLLHRSNFSREAIMLNVLESETCLLTLLRKPNENSNTKHEWATVHHFIICHVSKMTVRFWSQMKVL